MTERARAEEDADKSALIDLYGPTRGETKSQGGHTALLNRWQIARRRGDTRSFAKWLADLRAGRK